MYYPCFTDLDIFIFSLRSNSQVPRQSENPFQLDLHFISCHPLFSTYKSKHHICARMCLIGLVRITLGKNIVFSIKSPRDTIQTSWCGSQQVNNADSAKVIRKEKQIQFNTEALLCFCR